jgi:hypothetical protein
MVSFVSLAIFVIFVACKHPPPYNLLKWHGFCHEGGTENAPKIYSFRKCFQCFIFLFNTHVFSVVTYEGTSFSFTIPDFRSFWHKSLIISGGRYEWFMKHPLPSFMFHHHVSPCVILQPILSCCITKRCRHHESPVPCIPHYFIIILALLSYNNYVCIKITYYGKDKSLHYKRIPLGRLLLRPRGGDSPANTAAAEWE